MDIGELCNREVVVVEQDETVLAAAKLMRSYHVGDLVVVEKRQGVSFPVGILTDRDIVVELIAGEVDFDEVAIGDIMSFELFTVEEEDEVAETIKMMRDNGVRRVPVVNKEGGLEGIVSVDDLIDFMAEQMNDIVGLIDLEQKKERKKRV